MRKQVFLHIGHLKTGTTYLQHFCHIHRANLRNIGICYPQSGTTLKPGVGRPTGHHAVLALGLLEEKHLPVPRWYRQMKLAHPAVYDTRAQWQNTIAEVLDTSCSISVLSSEFFIRYADGHRTLQCLDTVATFLEPFDVTVICYLRRPDKMLESFYNELIKTSHKVGRLRGHAQRYRNTHLLEFAGALEPWIARFGLSHVVVRDYERLKGNDIVTDFFAAIGAPNASGFPRSNIPRNSRIPNALIEIHRLHNLLPESGRDAKCFRDAVSALLRDSKLVSDQQVELLSRADRTFLYQHTLELNRRLQSLLNLPKEQPFFENVVSILDPLAGASTDIEAGERYAGLLNMFLLRTQALYHESTAPPPT